MYVPFWLFDLDTGGPFPLQKRPGPVSGMMRIIHIQKPNSYHVVRSGKMKFEKIPVDGSRTIDDTTMEAIEPYDYKDLTEFDFPIFPVIWRTNMTRNRMISRNVSMNEWRRVSKTASKRQFMVCDSGTQTGEDHRNRKR